MFKLTEKEVNAFASACLLNLKQQVPRFKFLSLGEPYLKNAKTSQFDVSISNEISGVWEGKIFLSLGVHMSLEIAEAILGLPFNALEQEAQNALCKFCNKIVSEALQEISAQGAEQLAAPAKLIYGKNQRLASKECPWPFTVPILTDLGSLELDLALYKKSA